MPGQHSDEERERKERIKKMKIKTSKMRLAINLPSGKKVKFSNPKSILEAFKLSDIKKMRNNNADKDLNYDSLIKFRQFY